MHRTVHTYERFGNTLCVTFFNSFHLRWNASSGIIATKTFASQTFSYVLIGIHFSYTRVHTLTLIVERNRFFYSILNENNSATHASSHRHEWMRNLKKTPSVCVCVCGKVKKKTVEWHHNSCSIHMKKNVRSLLANNALMWGQYTDC